MQANLKNVTPPAKVRAELPEKMTYRDGLAAAMTSALSNYENTVIIGQGVTDFKEIFGTLPGLFKKFGSKRLIETPLSEEGVTGICIGAALNGLYPINTHIRADFGLLAFNQIIKEVAEETKTSEESPVKLLRAKFEAQNIRMSRYYGSLRDDNDKVTAYLQDESTKAIPVVMLTAHESESDRAVGFAAGASQYLTKPFGPLELIDTIRGILSTP